MRESNFEVFGLFSMLLLSFKRFSKCHSHILLKGNVCGILAEEDNNELQNSSRPTLIESAIHGELWRLPLNASFVLRESDAIELNYVTSST